MSFCFRPKISKLLVTNGADVNFKDPSGQTRLTWAIQEGEFEMAQTMITGNVVELVKYTACFVCYTCIYKV